MFHRLDNQVGMDHKIENPKICIRYIKIPSLIIFFRYYYIIRALNTGADTAAAIVDLAFVNVRAVMAISRITSWAGSATEASREVDALDARIYRT